MTQAAFVAPNATVVGDVTLGPLSNVWYGCVLRGDINRIVIGPGTSVQDLTIVHLSDAAGTEVGAYCTIGHAVILHACTIEDECLIGMGATILNGARIGARSIVGANALVTPGTVIPPDSLVIGTPAKVIRPLTEKERHEGRRIAERYIEMAKAHAARCPG
ncbi:MAG: gamma carbonic anhydrase family protein [Opitutaceae bacterium]|nr:gamma carbonic anhydrase family protein [Opitutaceae bacterium]